MRTISAVLIGLVAGFAVGCVISQGVGITLAATTGGEGIEGFQILKWLPLPLGVAGGVVAPFLDRKFRKSP